MKKMQAFGAAAFALTLAGGISSCTPPGHPAATLNFTAYQTEGKLTRPCDTCVIQGSKTSPVGAQFFGVETLKSNGVVVGHDVLYVPLVSSDSRGEFFITLDLAAGQITGQGIGNVDTGKGTLAITGGTGLFRGATGEITFHGISATATAVTVSIDK